MGKIKIKISSALVISIAVFLLILVPLTKQASDADNIIETVAGTGAEGYFGDDGPATSAKLNQPYRVAVDAVGNRYIADTINHVIRKIDSTGKITTFAGTGSKCSDPSSSCNDGKPATQAQLHYPHGVAVDGVGNGVGNVYIADTFNNKIRKVDTGGVMTTFAGTGAACTDSTSACGDGSSAYDAKLYRPYGIALGSADTLFVADTYNHKIREVRGGRIYTLAGNGTKGFGGDDSQATNAMLNLPRGITVDLPNKLLYIADTSNGRIRRVDLTTGIITTLAGTDGVPGAELELEALNICSGQCNSGAVSGISGNQYIAEVKVTNPSNVIKKVYTLAYVMEPDKQRTLTRATNGETLIELKPGESKWIQVTQGKPFASAGKKVDVQLELRDDAGFKNVVRGVFDVGKETVMGAKQRYGEIRYGISLSGSQGNTIEKNTIIPWAAVTASLYLSSSDNNKISSNRIDAQAVGHGIAVVAEKGKKKSENNKFSLNSVTTRGKRSHSIYIKSSSAIDFSGDRLQSDASAAVRINAGTGIKLYNVSFNKKSILFDDESEVEVSKPLPVTVNDGDTGLPVGNATIELVDTSKNKVFSGSLSGGSDTIKEVRESRIKGKKKS